MFFSIALFLIGLYLTGLGLFHIVKNSKTKLVAVKLEVVAFEEQENHEYHIINVPVFRVFSGEYQGTTKVSIYEEVNDKNSLKVGDLIDGFISLPNKELLSKESLPMKKWMPIWLLVIGIGFVFVCFYL